MFCYWWCFFFDSVRLLLFLELKDLIEVIDFWEKYDYFGDRYVEVYCYEDIIKM